MAHRRLTILIIFLILLTGISIWGPCGCSEPSGPRYETVTIKGRTFRLEVAATEDAITRGLGGRASIPADGGMLFIFPEPSVRQFWMYDCLADIDIIFLDSRGRITAMHRMKAEPPRAEGETEADYRARLQSYSSGERAQFAIELQAGMLDQLDLEKYEKIELDLDRLKALAQ